MKGLTEKWLRLLLRLYPPDFRDEMGRAMVAAYGERARETGRIGLAGVWLAALWDSMRNGLGERLRPAAAWRRSGDWGRDMELVVRRLRQRPLALLAVLGTLSAGLGTFAVVYTAVDKILVEALPYAEPNDLYLVWTDIPQVNVHGGTLSGPQVAEIQNAGGVIEQAAGFQCGSGGIPATPEHDAYHINMLVSTGNLFDVLGARPALGRGLRPEEAGQGGPTTLVLSDAMWQRLGADPGILGKPLRVGPDTYTVVGVMPPEFAFSCSPSQRPDVYTPVFRDPASESPTNYPASTLIRARRGATEAEVRDALNAVARTIVERVPGSRGLGLYPVGVLADLVEEVRPALVALSFTAVFLLLVLTVNLASLLLARAAEREQEFAVSRALGASGPAVVRAMLFEGAFLGLLGGVAGAALGMWGTRLLVALGPLDLPRRETIEMDWRIAAAVAGVGLALGLAAAAAPAAWAARISLSSLVAVSAVRGGARSGRMRRGLIVAQVALSLVLLSAGGLVVRSFERLVAADPGFRPEGVLTLRLSTIVFTDPADSDSFLDRATAALRTLPGVTDVSATTNLPLSDTGNSTFVRFPGAPGNTGEQDKDNLLVDIVRARAGYAETIGMRLLEGRTFGTSRSKGVREALIDGHLARQFFPNSSPLGATIARNNTTLTVVGVVDQARLHDLHRDGRPQVIVRAEDYNSRGYWFFTIRTSRDPKALITAARGAIRDIERRVPVSQMLTLDEIVAEARSRERISAALLGGLSLGALLLVTMGLFGMISGSVTRRRGELAVRLALGATHGRVIRLVVGEGARLLALGLLIGYPGTYLAGGALEGFLVGVRPDDAATLSAVALGLSGVALLACFVAARRVTRITPDRLLRDGG